MTTTPAPQVWTEETPGQHGAAKLAWHVTRVASPIAHRLAAQAFRTGRVDFTTETRNVGTWGHERDKISWRIERVTDTPGINWQLTMITRGDL